MKTRNHSKSANAGNKPHRGFEPTLGPNQHQPSSDTTLLSFARLAVNHGSSPTVEHSIDRLETADETRRLCSMRPATSGLASHIFHGAKANSPSGHPRRKGG